MKSQSPNNPAVDGDGDDDAFRRSCNFSISSGRSSSPLSSSFLEFLDEPSKSPVERAPDDDDAIQDEGVAAADKGVPLDIRALDVVPVPVAEAYDVNDRNNEDEDDDEPPAEKSATKREWSLQLTSITFFVIGSVLYLVCAVLDYQWARELEALPLWLRTADDDVAWENYRLEERYNATLYGGGVRRMRSRMLKLLEDAVVEEEGYEETEREKEQAERNDVKLLEKAGDEGRVEESQVAAKAESGKIQAETTGETTDQRRLQTPEELYYDLDWVELPSEIRDAYVILGFDQIVWDGGGETITGDLDWIELTEEQRQAALFIGYTEEIWCATLAPAGPLFTVLTPPPAPVTGKPTGSPTPAPVPVTTSPTKAPTPMPVTPSPTVQPTNKPVTASPTKQPTKQPILRPRTSKPTDTSIVVPGEPTSQTGPDPTAGIQSWEDLPTETREVYFLLGYIADSWNNGVKLPLDEKSWDDLAFDEKFRLLSLGYSKDSWDAVPPGEHFPNQPLPPTPTQWWADMSPESQSVYESLGYDEQLWNNGGKVPVDDKSWDELGFFERLAVLSLGYDESSWDEAGPGGHFPEQPSWPTPSPVTIAAVPPTPVPVTTIPTRLPSDDPTKKPTPMPVMVSLTKKPTTNPSMQPTAVPVTASPTKLTDSPTTEPTQLPPPSLSTWDSPEDLYGDAWWVELPVDIQNAYAILGYDEIMWNGGIEPASNDKDWAELSEEEKEAALFIGYTQETWDAEEEGEPTNKPTMAPTVPPPSTPEDLYGGEYWANLPEGIQDAYVVLGYNEEMWNFGIEPDSNRRHWAELSEEERQAALFVGYTAESWDAEAEESKPTLNPTMEPTAAVRVEPGYYDDYDWMELPAHIQEAYIVLGWDQKLWDMSGVAWSEDYDWDELSPEEQEAAAIVGYNRESWDNEDSTEVGDLDDYISYDDDYVFAVGNPLDDVWVSKYQIIMFFAALSFVFVGLLDLVRERRSFHILMILAGIFGVVSAVFVEEDIHLSNIFNCVSVHLFLLEGLTLFGQHKRSAISADAAKWKKCWIMLADLQFSAGALIDVIISYFFLFDETADWDIPLMIADIFSAVLWLNCSLIYMGSFFLH